MRHVDFKEPDDIPENEWYKNWKVKATKETQKVIEAYLKEEPYDFKPAIWGEVKDYLIKLFNRKCAYCESKFSHIAFGDVEHYRPKKGVTGNAQHKGYYWLAYHLRNLFPSCERCNRGGAKMNNFPVDADSYIYRHDENLDKENPLLLNPYDDYPDEDDLKFAPPVKGTPLGTVTHKSKKGEISIKIYKLDREDLNTERSQEQANVLNDILLRFVRRESVAPILGEIEKGLREYSAALLVVADEWVGEVDESIKEYKRARRESENGDADK